jgi:hypothetical protein
VSHKPERKFCADWECHFKNRDSLISKWLLYYFLTFS